MQIDELAPPAFTTAYPVSQPDDPYVADLLQLADGRCVYGLNGPLSAWLTTLLSCHLCRIHELQEDIIKVRLDLENAQECVKHLNTQVRNGLAGGAAMLRDVLRRRGPSLLRWS